MTSGDVRTVAELLGRKIRVNAVAPGPISTPIFERAAGSAEGAKKLEDGFASGVPMMLAMAAVASGAIWLRITIYAALSAGLPFDPVYAVATWACWIVPLALAAYFTKSKAAGIAPGRSVAILAS